MTASNPRNALWLDICEHVREVWLSTLGWFVTFPLGDAGCGLAPNLKGLSTTHQHMVGDNCLCGEMDFNVVNDVNILPQRLHPLITVVSTGSLARTLAFGKVYDARACVPQCFPVSTSRPVPKGRPCSSTTSTQG